LNFAIETLKESTMKRNASAGWLIVSLLPLFAFTLLSLSSSHHAAVRAPINADQVSAELARTVSYGFVDQAEHHVYRRGSHAASQVDEPVSELRGGRGFGTAVGL
jgi:hypothetical protein